MLFYLAALRQSLLLRDPLIKYGYLLGIAANVSAWGLLIWAALTRLAHQEFLALHTTIYFGIDLIGPSYRLFFYPLLGLIIILANATLVVAWGKRDIFLAHASAAFTALLELMLLLGSLFVVLLNL